METILDALFSTPGRRGTIWYSWVMRLKWKLGLVILEIVLILMHGRCMVCMEHTICLEINLDAADGTPY
jgi:hypothetical protein